MEIKVENNQLKKPDYLYLDIKEGLLKWSRIEYANKYKIIINDETFYSETNEMEYWLKTNNFTCSVQAIDSANYFKESQIITIQKYYDNLYLPKVKNLVYDPNTSILSWDKVEGAYKYKVEADYGVYIIKDNRFKYEPKYKTTFFKVSTVPSSTDYLSNNPSSLSYEDKESDLWDSVDLDKVNKFVNEMTRAWDLVKIASMYVDDKFFYVQGWFEDNDGIQVVDLERYYNEKVSTLKEVMIKDKIALG